VCSTRQAGRCCLAETECGQSTPQNTHEYRHFKTFQKVLRTGIRLPGPCPLFFKTASPSLRGFRISVAQKATFLNCFGLPTPRNLKRARINQSQETFLSRTQTSSIDLPVVHGFQNFWVELLAVRGNFEAKNIMTWHMNWGYGTSCASGPQKVVGDVYKRGTRMACHIPSTARRNIDPLMCQSERRE
jgi:hypothetical protein